MAAVHPFRPLNAGSLLQNMAVQLSDVLALRSSPKRSVICHSRHHFLPDSTARPGGRQPFMKPMFGTFTVVSRCSSKLSMVLLGLRAGQTKPIPPCLSNWDLSWKCRQHIKWA